MTPQEREERLDWAMAAVLEPVPRDRHDEEIIAAARAIFDELSRSIVEERFPRAEMIIAERLSLAAERLPVAEWADTLKECAARLYHSECYDLAALVNVEASLGCCRAQCYGDALEFSDRAVRLAERAEDDAALASALHSQGACLTSVGDYPEARRVLDAVEVPAERPDILFCQAFLEARLEAVTQSNGFHEAAQTAFDVAHRYGLKPSRCSIGAVLLGGAMARNGNQKQAAKHLVPGLEYLLRNRFERLISPIAAITTDGMNSDDGLRPLVQPLEAIMAAATVGFAAPEERGAFLLALRAAGMPAQPRR